MKAELDENIKKLLVEFYLIQCKGWVKSQGKGTSAAGRTLEYLLGKKEDAKSLPDYYGIELKTKLCTSNYPLRLFSAVLDNRPNVMNELYEKCSWKRTRNEGERELFDFISSTKFSNTHRKYAFKLKVNRPKRRVELLMYNNWNKTSVYNDMSWSFDELELRLTTKLSCLAIIHAWKMTLKETDTEYFKYASINLYRLKSFENFIDLIEEGKIDVDLKLYPYYIGENKGKLRNRETTFVINESDIYLLFDKMDIKLNDILKEIPKEENKQI